MIYLVYIAACLGGVWLANRSPVFTLGGYQSGGVTYMPNARPLGYMTGLCMLGGAACGGILPTGIGPGGGLCRLAVLVGAVSGAYIGARAVCTVTMVILGVAALWVLGWVLGFH